MNIPKTIFDLKEGDTVYCLDLDSLKIEDFKIGFGYDLVLLSNRGNIEIFYFKKEAEDKRIKIIDAKIFYHKEEIKKLEEIRRVDF